MIIEFPIQYWYGEDSIQDRDESFWTKDAMERAVGQYTGTATTVTRVQPFLCLPST